jgi:hypothetical protein
MADLPLMPKATAVWLGDNTTLTFRQIAEFTGMHELEISGIADGEVAIGIKGMDPVANHQLSREEIERCEKNPIARLKLLKREIAPEQKRKGPRYTPLSKRQERPSAIAWLVRYHPELSDGQIMKLVGTTKPTIESIRDRSHWNSANIRPVDPVALGLCKQIDLDAAVQKAAKKSGDAEALMSPEERMSLLSTDESLASDDRRPIKGFAGLENFTLSDRRDDDDDRDPRRKIDADSLFNLPAASDEDEDEDDLR